MDLPHTKTHIKMTNNISNILSYFCVCSYGYDNEIIYYSYVKHSAETPLYDLYIKIILKDQKICGTETIDETIYIVIDRRRVVREWMRNIKLMKNKRINEM